MAAKKQSINVYGARLTRRQFVKTGGVLIVGFSFAGPKLLESAAEAAASKNTMDPTLPASWFEIKADNTILMSTGKVDVVTGGGKTISYCQLVQGQQLKLSIPVGGTLNSLLGLTVLGDPPMKPVSQYTVIGKSYPNAVTPSKVTAKEVWITDVRLPDMLHARVIHPKSLGSTLISAGKVDKTKFPNARVVVKQNLVGVLAPTEWEAIKASQQVAADTKWTDWKGLPGNANLYTWLREEADWKATPVSAGQKNQGAVQPALASAPKKVSATYE